MLPLCFKRDRYISGKGRRNDDYDYYVNFQTLSPTISLREAKRPPRAGGNNFFLEIENENESKIYLFIFEIIHA